MNKISKILKSFLAEEILEALRKVTPVAQPMMDIATHYLVGLKPPEITKTCVRVSSLDVGLILLAQICRSERRQCSVPTRA